MVNRNAILIDISHTQIIGGKNFMKFNSKFHFTRNWSLLLSPTDKNLKKKNGFSSKFYFTDSLNNIYLWLLLSFSSSDMLEVELTSLSTFFFNCK